MRIRRWEMTAPGQPLRACEVEAPPPGPGEVLVRVAGCGVCHTDLGFLHGGVKTRHPLPLALGHEVSGVVEEAGAQARSWLGAEVVVPAVLPCGVCAPCRKGRGSICAAQVFPGNDVPGGFATHLVVPARGLCRVPDGGSRVPLARLAVVADAVSTPYQAVRRSGLARGDVAVFVGVGGVGAFGVQIAAALGALVAAVDVDKARLDLVRAHGAALAFDASAEEPRAIRSAIRREAKAAGLAETEWKLFETSGTRAGQETAFQLLVPGAYLGVVGFTTESATVPVSRLMAFDARAEGSWGCLPELYPEALAMALDGRVNVGAPFTEEHPLSAVNHVLDAVHARRLRARPVLVPELG